ncbi:MAG: SdiA-regulated domain-containing protein [Bdellovibrionales bacterium]|nr:SdiA-regulated domain-containing protein [Bdellovibrionales bacterium]
MGGNLSGITYNYDTGTYFMVQNNYGKLFEYDRSLKKQLRVIEMKNLKDDDTEGIFYLGRDRFAISSEDNHIHIFTIRPGDTVLDLNSAREDVQDFTLPPPSKKNKGLEGVCLAPSKNGGRGTFYTVQEASPKKVYTFEFPASDADVTSPKVLGVKELFNADKALFLKMSDLSDCTFDTESDHLFLLSHESSKVMEFSRTGEEIGSLKLPTVAPQYEGITFGPDRELILVSEPNSVVIMKKNH